MNKALILTIAGIGGSGATLGSGIGAVTWLDDRYAPLAVVEDLAWSSLKGDIRDIRGQIAAAENEQLKALLELDLQDTIDRLCKNYPDDRECNKD